MAPAQAASPDQLHVDREAACVNRLYVAPHPKVPRLPRRCALRRYSRMRFSPSISSSSRPIRSSRTLRRGFTLVEILIVVIILGILASIIIGLVGSTQKDASVGALKDDLR